MYRLGVKPHHRRRIYIALAVLAVILIIIGVFVIKHMLRPNTTVSNSAAIIRHVGVATPATKTVSTPTFTMDIPTDWQKIKSKLIPAAQYAWQGTAKNDTSRWIEIYVDNIPATMAVNHLMPVRANGSQLVLTDDVSDNCVDFTDASSGSNRTGSVLAKWSGVAFYCDTGNYVRDVVGTGSPGAINSVTLKGKAAGSHRYFFLYTDNSAEADYSYFTNILNSFEAR